MGWRELLLAAGPGVYLLLGLSLYGVYLLYGFFLLRREGRVEPGVAEGLGHLAQLAPLVGLLGTTFGMIRAFLALGGGGGVPPRPGHRRGPGEHRPRPPGGGGELRGLRPLLREAG